MKNCCLALRTQARKKLWSTTIKEASTRTKEHPEWVNSGKQWAALDEDPRNYTAVNPIHYGLPLQPLYNAYRQ